MKPPNLFTVASLLALTLTGSASAAEPSPADERRLMEYYQVGVKAFRAKQFDQAATAFELAYEIDERQNLLWNIARSYEEAGQWEKALDRFEAYLSRDDIPSDNRIEATERLVKIRSEVKRIQSEREAAESEPPEAAPPPRAEPESEEVAMTPAPTVTETTTIDGEGPSPWSWVTIGLGAAAIGTGVALHFVAEGKRKEVTGAPIDDQGRREITMVEADDLEREANTLDSAGAVVIGIGSAAVITGVVLLFTTGGETTVAPAVTGDQVSMVATGRF